MGMVAQESKGALGVLILDGLLAVSLDAGRAHVGWLVGAHDLLRPWELDNFVLTRRASWQALTPTVMAVLDAEFERRAAMVPGVMSALLAGAQRTSQWLLAKSLVLSSPIVEERIMLLFALLGERWGRVCGAEVRVDLPLTHAVIARLIGARRPSVSGSLKSLADRGVLLRDGPGWLLCRGNGGVRPSCWEEYAAALGCWSGTP